MGIIRADAGKTVRIGYQGENKRQRVAFPLQDIMEEFPGGTAVLAILRKDDTDPVPAAITEMDGTDLIWTVTAWECAKEGYLYAQITYAVGEVVSKTKTYRFDIKNSLIVSAAEPETWQDMVGQLVTAAAALQAAIAEYDAMTAAAIALPAGSDPTAEIDRSGEHPVLRLGIAPGADGHDGEDGYSPSASVVKVGKKATITIVDKDGTTTAEISDGEDGQGGDVIDDTAGAGDTDKTWSADKLTDELAGKYEKPSSGIPATDLAAGVIPDPTDLIDDTAGAGDTDVTFSADKLATDHSSLLNQINVLQPTATSGDVGKFLKAKTVADGKVTEYEFGSGGGGGTVTDVQINGTSIINQGTANIPIASNSDFGVVKTGTSQGVEVSDGVIRVGYAGPATIKAGSNLRQPIVPYYQHNATFYGLAKAAGDSTQSASANAVGTYTESAKSAIASMLDAPETISGTTPSITAKAGVRYICGECSTLTIVVPSSGCIDVTFESGSTPTVLTVTPPTGMTMKWANGFDPTALEANTTYEINIMDGCLGVAGSWT